MFVCSCLLQAKLFSSGSSERRGREGEALSSGLFPSSLVEAVSMAANWAMGMG